MFSEKRSKLKEHRKEVKQYRTKVHYDEALLGLSIDIPVMKEPYYQDVYSMIDRQSKVGMT